jgi:hypothetical protein
MWSAKWDSHKHINPPRGPCPVLYVLRIFQFLLIASEVACNYQKAPCSLDRHEFMFLWVFWFLCLHWVTGGFRTRTMTRTWLTQQWGSWLHGDCFPCFVFLEKVEGLRETLLNLAVPKCNPGHKWKMYTLWRNRFFSLARYFLNPRSRSASPFKFLVIYAKRLGSWMSWRSTNHWALKGTGGEVWQNPLWGFLAR